MTIKRGAQWPDRASNWRELFENLAIHDQADSHVAGRRFEIFCKHFFLSNRRICRDYKNVWLQSEVPASIKRALNLASSDFGYDLVLQLIDGRLAVGQCKFTSNPSGKTLSWSKDRLSSWLAASTKADVRILFTNASGVDKETRKKAREAEYHEYNLAHLNDLNEDDFRAILASINGQKTSLKRTKPRPHQEDAVAAVLKGFEHEARGKLILPCGAGKTLTALWVKEALKADRVLVLVPSLSLLRQFKDQWKANEGIRSEFFCVCSEKDIGVSVDGLNFLTPELGSNVTTDPQEIRNQLNASGRVVVYATYQSSKKITLALKGSGVVFDLIVCDEAHRTSGALDSDFATALDDRAIPSRRRLFMTATPRIVSKAVRSKLGDHYRYLADMNDEAVYGPEFFRMSFAEAIKCGILCDYKIVAIGITDKEIQHQILERKFGEGTTVDEWAHNYALLKLMKKHGASHALTFHSTVSRAQEFLDRHESISSVIPAFHVNGTQSTCERSEILREFGESSTAIVTNARCLNEGVDVPAIDCVYFCDQKTSKIDIVQASGRALRTIHGHKKIGYIVIPVFHHVDDDVELVAETGAFSNLIKVVRALADHDSRIEDEIARVSYGKGTTSKSSPSSNPGPGNTEILTLQGFRGRLRASIFSQVITNAIIRWRPFDQARLFVRALGLKNVDQWQEYCAGKCRHLPALPDDIPRSPHSVYRGAGWTEFGDWLGTGNVSNWGRQYRDFSSARAFVRQLKLTGLKQWRQYVEGEFGDLPPMPADIPASPANGYKDEWLGWGDWLGTGTVAKMRRVYLDYHEAKVFVHRLGLKSSGQWREYAAGRRADLPPLPKGIPASASSHFRNHGWKGWGDWLGTNAIATYKRRYRSYGDAVLFVKELKLRSYKEWVDYCGGRRPDLPAKPDDIPAKPMEVYKDQGYTNILVWLGAPSTVSSKTVRRTKWENYLSFEEAREFARGLRLKNEHDWRGYVTNRIGGLAELPENIPRYPGVTYKNDGWRGFKDWLGVAEKFRSFENARAFVHHLKLKSNREWRLYLKNELGSLPDKPADIPATPELTYRGKGWLGWTDWLGG